MTIQAQEIAASDPVDAGYLACSLLRVCSAAANFADENEGCPAGKNMHGYIAQVLQHTERLVGETLTALELELQNKRSAA